MLVRAKGILNVAWPDFTVYFGMTDLERLEQWISPAAIVQGAEATKLCNATSSPAAPYVSRRAWRDDDVSEFLRLVMRIEDIVLAVLAFFNLAMTGIVYYEERGSVSTVVETMLPMGFRGPCFADADA